MIPLVQPILGKDEVRIVSKIIRSRQIASGTYVEELERQTASYNGTKFAVANANGTTALHTALLACGILKGDRVLTTPFSFIATANSILHCGAVPVFADIDPRTYNLSPESAERALKKQRSIKAILVVHLYGLPADMGAFKALAKRYKVSLIEDCAQAHGALYKGKMVGSFGNASGFSYYATKNITMGEGGMTLTNDANVDRRARQVINHGREGHSTHTMLGYNFRLTNIAAGIGLVQLKQLDKWNEARLSNARFLNKGLAKCGYLSLPVIPGDCRPVFHQYTVRVPSSLRDAFMKHMKGSGVGCGVYYPEAIYNQPLYRAMGFKPGICPEAEKAAREVVSLPVHPSLTINDLRKIIAAASAFKGRG